MADIEVPSGEDFEIEMNGTSGLKIGSAGGITGSVVKDEDAMTSDSNTHIATQQSIKKYVDDQVGNNIPAEPSSTDNAVVRWDGASGDAVQDSLMTVDDSGTANIPSSQHYNVNGSQHQHVEADITDLGTYLENVVEDTTPELGGDLGRSPYMSLYPMSMTSDDTACGEGTVSATLDAKAGGAAAIAIADPLFYNSSGAFELSNADDPSTMLCVALSLEVLASGSSGDKRVLFKGTIRNDAWAWTPTNGVGNLIYVEAALGSLTQTKPSSTGDIVQCVGWVINADTIFFNPQLTYETVA